METNYVLIDFENVQPESLEPLNHDRFKVVVFVGAKQGKLSRQIVMSIQKLGSRAEYVEITRHGSNALDFHIAYYIGRFAVEVPSADFQIISKDRGFDPLIDHLKTNGISVRRLESVTEIISTNGKPATTEVKPPAREKFNRVVAFLKKQSGQSRPRKEKTLKSAVKNLFKNNRLSKSELNALITELKSTGKVKVDGTSVTYDL